MTKKYRIYEIAPLIIENQDKVFFHFKEPDELLWFNYDSLQEAEDAIARYGYDYVNYIIQPIYRTDGD